MLIKIRFTFTGFYLIYASKHDDKLLKFISIQATDRLTNVYQVGRGT